MLFHRKRRSHDVAVYTVSCSLKMLAQSDVILDTSSEFPPGSLSGMEFLNLENRLG